MVLGILDDQGEWLPGGLHREYCRFREMVVADEILGGIPDIGDFLGASCWSRHDTLLSVDPLMDAHVASCVIPARGDRVDLSAMNTLPWR